MLVSLIQCHGCSYICFFDKLQIEVFTDTCTKGNQFDGDTDIFRIIVDIHFSIENNRRVGSLVLCLLGSWLFLREHNKEPKIDVIFSDCLERSGCSN